LPEVHLLFVTNLKEFTKKTAKYREQHFKPGLHGLFHVASEVKHMDSSHTEMQKFFAE
jgi:hypothetical protein